MIYYFCSDNDFITNGNKNYAYFFINLIISLILSFFGFVFNEFIILFCCELEIDTHSQIVTRSIKEEEILNLSEINIDEEE